MKLLLVSILLVMLTACSQQVVYDTLHERERQECLKRDRGDCPRAESYDKYKKQREEAIGSEDVY